MATYYTTSNLVLSYKEHVQALVAFNTHKLSQITSCQYIAIAIIYLNSFKNEWFL